MTSSSLALDTAAETESLFTLASFRPSAEAADSARRREWSTAPGFHSGTTSVSTDSDDEDPEVTLWPFHTDAGAHLLNVFTTPTRTAKTEPLSLVAATPCAVSSQTGDTPLHRSQAFRALPRVTAPPRSTNSTSLPTTAAATTPTTHGARSQERSCDALIARMTFAKPIASPKKTTPARPAKSATHRLPPVPGTAPQAPASASNRVKPLDSVLFFLDGLGDAEMANSILSASEMYTPEQRSMSLSTEKANTSVVSPLVQQPSQSTAFIAALPYSAPSPQRRTPVPVAAARQAGLGSGTGTQTVGPAVRSPRRVLGTSSSPGAVAASPIPRPPPPPPSQHPLPLPSVLSTDVSMSFFRACSPSTSRRPRAPRSPSRAAASAERDAVDGAAAVEETSSRRTLSALSRESFKPPLDATPVRDNPSTNTPPLATAPAELSPHETVPTRANVRHAPPATAALAQASRARAPLPLPPISTLSALPTTARVTHETSPMREPTAPPVTPTQCPSTSARAAPPSVSKRHPDSKADVTTAALINADGFPSSPFLVPMRFDFCDARRL